MGPDQAHTRILAFGKTVDAESLQPRSRIEAFLLFGGMISIAFAMLILLPVPFRWWTVALLSTVTIWIQIPLNS